MENRIAIVELDKQADDDCAHIFYCNYGFFNGLTLPAFCRRLSSNNAREKGLFGHVRFLDIEIFYPVCWLLPKTLAGKSL